MVSEVLAPQELAKATDPQPPDTPVREVVDDYFGTKVSDPYRWLENSRDPEVIAWLKAQNDYARAILASIPGRDQLLDRINADFRHYPLSALYRHIKQAEPGKTGRFDDLPIQELPLQRGELLGAHLAAIRLQLLVERTACLK